MSRRVLSGSLANRETTDASSDDVPSPSPRKWVVSASETRPVHDTFGLSRIYLPGPGPQSKESEVDDKEDGIPDADVAVDDEGNAAQKALMITRVPEGATLEDLTQLLGGFGECVVFMRSTHNRGYAHAVFRRLKDSQKVMRAQFTNPFCVRDKILRVLYSKNPSDFMLHSRPVTGRTIWVSNIPYSATSREIAALFAPYGKICRVNLPRNPNGQLLGYGHIEYTYPEEAGAALLASRYRPYTLHRRPLWVMPAKVESRVPSVIPLRSPEEDRRVVEDHRLHPTYPPSRFLWVGALRPSVRRRDLRAMLEPVCGLDNIVDIRIIRLQQQGAKNVFAHVELRTLRAAERIMRRHRRHPLSVLLGERLTVMLEYAAPLVKDAEPSYTLFTPFVRGDEMDVRTLFGSHAKNIRQIRFHARPVVDPSGRAAFIEFLTTFQAMAAKQAMDQKKINDETRLILVYAKKRYHEGTEHRLGDNRKTRRLGEPGDEASEAASAVISPPIISNDSPPAISNDSPPTISNDSHPTISNDSHPTISNGHDEELASHA